MKTKKNFIPGESELNITKEVKKTKKIVKKNSN